MDLICCSTKKRPEICKYAINKCCIRCDCYDICHKEYIEKKNTLKCKIKPCSIEDFDSTEGNFCELLI